MSNNEVKYFDLVTHLSGYPKFLRAIDSRAGKYSRIKTSARFGRQDDARYVNYDIKIVREADLNIINTVFESHKDSKITWGIVVGDAEPRIYPKKDGTPAVEILSRLLAIRWIAVDGKLIVDNRDVVKVEDPNTTPDSIAC